MNWSNHIYQTSSQLINVNHINSSRSTSFGFLYNQFMNILLIPKVLYDIVMNCDIQMHPLIPICNHYQVMKKFMNKKEIELYKNYWGNRLVLTSNDHYLQKFATDLLN